MALEAKIKVCPPIRVPVNDPLFNEGDPAARARLTPAVSLPSNTASAVPASSEPSSPPALAEAPHQPQGRPPASPPGSNGPPCPGCQQRDQVISELQQRLAALEQRIRELEARLGLNSSNSSIPPSANPLSAPPPVRKKPTGRKRGAQPGHRGHRRDRLPPGRVDHVIPLIPSHCERCHAPLPQQPSPGDPEPTWHQFAELPPVVAVVTEFQGHARTCPCCKHVTREHIPQEITANAFGPRLSAAAGYLAGSQQVSNRGLEEISETLFGVPVSLGSINAMQQQLGAALEQPHQQIGALVRNALVKNVDETTWKREAQRCWLWAGVLADAAFFLIRPKRDMEALQALLGKRPLGVVGSDRAKAYLLLPSKRRQFCWAHLKRDFQAMVDRQNEGSAAGKDLLWWTEQLFNDWWAFRAGRIDRAELRKRMRLVRVGIRYGLQAGLVCGCAKTEATCAELLGSEESLWVFVEVEGVEPTNNAAERALRRAVLWRKRCFGSQSEAGCRFVERILSIVQTLRLRGRQVLDFLTEALTAHRYGLPIPNVLATR